MNAYPQQRRLHVLYEYDVDCRPRSCSFVRLLRPLLHPSLQEKVKVTVGLQLGGQQVDAVIVDRLWRPDITPSLAEDLIKEVRQSGAQFIYALDDNFLDLQADREGEINEEQLGVVEYWLRQADAVWVTTPALKERLTSYNPQITVIPQALDERLLVPVDLLSRGASLFGDEAKLRIGYMGTFTHDDDLLMVLPALQEVLKRYPEQVEFQIGAVGRPETVERLKALPAHFVRPLPAEIEYPLFMLWFTGHVRWDIAIAPLKDTPFTHCKSDIKFLDYSAIGAAGVYSRVPAYVSSVSHMETGWLAENRPEAWAEALEALISNQDIRARLSKNSTRYLYTKRTLARSARDWLEALGDFLDWA
jgi:glycosyltransferase involved in cell wall biosynthesis